MTRPNNEHSTQDPQPWPWPLYLLDVDGGKKKECVLREAHALARHLVGRRIPLRREPRIGSTHRGRGRKGELKTRATTKVVWGVGCTC